MVKTFLKDKLTIIQLFIAIFSKACK